QVDWLARELGLEDSFFATLLDTDPVTFALAGVSCGPLAARGRNPAPTLAHGPSPPLLRELQCAPITTALPGDDAHESLRCQVRADPALERFAPDDLPGTVARRRDRAGRILGNRAAVR